MYRTMSWKTISSIGRKNCRDGHAAADRQIEARRTPDLRKGWLQSGQGAANCREVAAKS
jgi:hypothetical protein